MSFVTSDNQYVALIRFTRNPFSVYHYINASAPYADEALRRCRENASKEGWRVPAWWQWWRREDSLEPFVQPCTDL